MSVLSRWFAALALVALFAACNQGPGQDSASSEKTDGSVIAFTVQTARDPAPFIAIVPAEGGTVTRLAQGSDPSWSPDGTRLAFACHQRICTMNADGSDVETLTTPDGGAIDEEPSWGSASYIAFTRNYMDGRPRDIFVVAGDGGAARQLTKPRSDDFGPSWSPDGESIVFIRVPSGTVESAPHDDPERSNQVWTMVADGTGLRRITAINAGAWRPVWSPDGSEIAFDAAEAIWIVPVEDGQPRKLEPATRGEGIEGLGAFPSWSPDARRIAYTCSTGEFDDNDLCVMKADGTSRTTILDTPANEASPAWQNTHN